MADELLANSPKNPLRRFLEFTVVFMVVNLFLSFFKTGQLTVDMVKELVTAGLMVAGLAFVYHQRRKSSIKLRSILIGKQFGTVWCLGCFSLV
ncbi:hypothetical protein [Streptococcus sp. E24BD]|uniref:hypothetical protein n=1 Tax=Streptococcus sp. E24BD TaxID=3278715 RepID=UPI00359DB1A2